MDNSKSTMATSGTQPGPEHKRITMTDVGSAVVFHGIRSTNATDGDTDTKRNRQKEVHKARQTQMMLREGEGHTHTHTHLSL